MCIFRHGSVTETVCHYQFRKPNYEESITKITYYTGQYAANYIILIWNDTLFLKAIILS